VNTPNELHAHMNIFEVKKKMLAAGDREDGREETDASMGAGMVHVGTLEDFVPAPGVARARRMPSQTGVSAQVC